jgi:hypothetical protein
VKQKVICIDNKSVSLTIGKVYELTDRGLIDDVGTKRWYHPDRFKTLEEYREEKLKYLLC